MTDLASAEADLDLRLVRYFAVVAGHRHFGRAAAELRIAQPSLSRQVRQLEAQVGARLLDRDRQGTRLTEAGEAFLPRARALLRSAAQARAAAQAAAEPTRIIVGYTAGLIITPAVRNLRRKQPDADVQALHLEWNEPRGALLGYRVDAAVTRLPLQTDGVAAEHRERIIASAFHERGDRLVHRGRNPIHGQIVPPSNGILWTTRRNTSRSSHV